MQTPVEGFSRFSKEEKIDWVVEHYANNAKDAKRVLTKYWNDDSQITTAP